MESLSLDVNNHGTEQKRLQEDKLLSSVLVGVLQLILPVWIVCWNVGQKFRTVGELRPGVEHVVNEELIEAYLGPWNGTGSSVELRHHHRETSLLFILSLETEIRDGGKRLWRSHLTWAKYSSAILSAQILQVSLGLAGLLTSAHFINILLMTAVSTAATSLAATPPVKHEGEGWGPAERPQSTWGAGRLQGEVVLAAELVDVKEMFAHVRSEDDINQTGPHRLVDVTIQVGEDVDSLVWLGEFEPEGGVVVLQDRGVVVQDGQLTAAVTQEGAVATRVVDIVDNGAWKTELRHTLRPAELRTYQADDAVQVIQVVGDVLLF